MAAKNTQKTISQNLLYKILWYLARFLLLSFFLNDENFKGEVEQTNFCDTFSNYSTIILLTTKTPPVKIWSNKFQMVMINYSKLCGSL